MRRTNLGISCAKPSSRNKVDGHFKEQSNAQCWHLKGTAIEYKQRAGSRKALRCFLKAAELEDTNLWFKQAVADSHYLLGKISEAETLNNAIIEEIRKKPTDADHLGLLGWCMFRLERYDESIRASAKALQLRRDSLGYQFNLALATFGSGRFALGLEEYQGGVKAASDKEAPRRRGILDEARVDLQIAMERLPKLEAEPQVHEAMKLLEKEYDKADRESATFLKMLAGQAEEPVSTADNASQDR